MTISPELGIAITAAVISVLGAIAAIARFVPPLVKRHFDNLQQSQSQEVEDRRKRMEAELEQQRANSALLLSMANNLDTLTKAVVKQQEIDTDNKLALDANTKAITSITEQNAEVVKRFDQLLDTGSKPLRDLHDKFNTMAKDLVSIRTDTEALKTNTDRAAIELAASRLQLEQFVGEGNEIMNSLKVLVALAEDKLRDIRKATSEISAITPNSTG